MRKRPMKTNLLMSIFALLLCACASDAFGQINPDPLYHIVAKHSDKCLDVVGGASENGADVIQKDCSDAASQKWRILPMNDGTDYYRIIAEHGGRALDVNGGIFTLWDGAPVKLWDFYNSANQMWKFSVVDGDFYKVTAKHSGLSLDISGGVTNNGAIAQQWQDLNGDNQKWKLVPLNAGPACASDQTGSTLVGTSSLLVSRVSNIRFTQPANLTLDFIECRGRVRITRIEATTRLTTTPFGTNSTTATLTSVASGFINPDRDVSVQLMFRFVHSLERSPNPIAAALMTPSDLTVALTGRVAPNGDVTLRGSGTFVGGYLNGSTGDLNIIGRITPSP
jgi:hypothetical protein